MLWAAVLTAVLINTAIGQLLPPIVAFMLIIHVLGFFAVLIPLVYMAPQKSSAHDVFTVFSNRGNWPTQGLSFFIGLLGSVYSMFGCDSAVHMAEEVRDADVTVPWSMLWTTLLNDLFGFAMVFGVVFIVPASMRPFLALPHSSVTPICRCSINRRALKAQPRV